jgi:hypothetical protein
MPDFGTWLGWNELGNLEAWYRQFDRADSVTFMIQHRGVNLTLARGTSTLAAQTALLVPAGRNNEASESAVDTGIAAHEQLLIVGLPTMDIQRGDRFKNPASLTRLNYEVVRVEKALYGMIQAFAEEVQ